jgi:serine/threonine protein kinase/DNA polymerase III delta prime subunit
MEPDEDSIQKLRNMLDTPDSHSIIPTVLARLGIENECVSPHTSIGSLALLLRHDLWQVRLSAIRRLRLLAEPAADQLLKEALEDENEFVRMMAAQALEDRSKKGPPSPTKAERLRTSSSLTNRVGQQFGNYRLVKLLGRGGCAEVYLGKHRHLNSYAALKALNATIDPGNERQFLAEAQALVDLRHPHIVHLRDFCIEDGTPVLIMDYALKGSLRQYHPDGTQMPLTTVVNFVEQIASALQYAHNHQIVHCDVKPENILLDADNRLLLSDFGLSLMTPSSQQLSTQDPAGTARYIAPEQLRGKPCFASDQYALAVMIYEWLCGDPPFRGTVWEISHQHLSSDPPSLCAIRPELPPVLEKVILRALAKKPEERFGSILEFAQALAQASRAFTSSIGDIDVQVSDPQLVTPDLLPIVHAGHTALLPSQNSSIVQKPIRGQAKDQQELLSPPTLQDQNRMRLLQRVRSFWITGVLEQSLHGAALLSLELQVQPSAVVSPWRLITQETERTSTPLPAGTRITEVYDQTGGELLILGEPGAGKTTLLLELARDLLKRCEQERTHPIPVVFNLSSWTRKRQPLATWLIEELETKYKVPGKIGSDWIKTNQILPLLDGLDEVDGAYRPACMQAINDYHQMHSLVPLVVCCRVQEYLSQANQLALSHAVIIQPLTIEQINKYLACIGERVASLCMAFQKDPVLQEMATTPLMLMILILVYQDASLEEIKGSASAAVRREQIFATYAERMLKRRSARSRYGPQQTIHWLSYLARQMKQQSQTVFYIERMQPAWLQKKWQRRLYYALVTGPICGLLVGLETLGSSWSLPLTVLMIALVVGLLFGWLSEPGTEKKSTKTITHIWMSIRQRLATALENRVMMGVAAGCVFGIGTALYFFLVDFSHWSLGSRIAGALADGLLNGTFIGVSVGLVIRVERRIEPLEALNWSWVGIRRDIVRWLPIGIGLIVGLSFALLFMISSHDVWVANFLSYGVSTVFQLCFIITLVSGVTRRLSRRVLDAQHIVTPNQGIWRSARYGIVMAIITGGIIGAFSAAIDLLTYFWLPLHMGFTVKKALDIDREAVSVMSHLLGFSPSTSQEFWALHALFWGPVGAVIPALAVGLSCGGVAYVQHFVLRLLLWCERSVPLNYPRFLDYAAERILLRKVGGGYIFVHRLLLEYFADVETAATPSAQASPQEVPLLPANHELRVPRAMLQGSLNSPRELDECLNPMKQGPRLGQQVGEYRLERKLGNGSFGIVYLAEHVHEHTQVAVKVLDIRLTKREDFKEFINEVRTTLLHHPHMVPLLDFGISHGDIPFLVMEYAPRGTLRDRHPRGDRVALSTLISYVEQLASALQYAHDRRVIHRDIKPENILIGRDGTLMVSDFGFAKFLEQNGVVSQQGQVGTPAYMAPEQHRGYPCFASDQYALAVVTYEWICGVCPFQGTALSVAVQHMNTPPPALRGYVPTLPEAVERVIFKALAKLPEDRFERIQEFADALREAVLPLTPPSSSAALTLDIRNDS